MPIIMISPGWTGRCFFALYIFTGLGITVGYHRLYAHRSFKCAKLVEIFLLIGGGMALQAPALRWAGDHIRHHARCDKDEDPYNAKLGFWWSHIGWVLRKDPNRDEKYMAKLKQNPLIMWQHRNYLAIIIGGLLFPFIIGFLYNGWVGGIGCFLLGRSLGEHFLSSIPRFLLIQSAIFGEVSPTALLIQAVIAGLFLC